MLISSDVMSRGIDVEDIDTVINYDKPQNERLFVHRVGRTARCGKRGTAVSLVTTREVLVFNFSALQFFKISHFMSFLIPKLFFFRKKNCKVLFKKLVLQ